MLRWHFRGFPSAAAPERNVLRLHRKEGEWAPMGRLKGVHPDAGKEVAEVEVLLSRFMEEEE